MAITYDAGTNTITITATGNDFDDPYQADQAGGWNVYHKQGNLQYLSDAKIKVGNGSTTSDWKDKDAQLTFSSLAVDGNSQKLIEVTAQATLELGQADSVNEKATSRGCHIIFDNADDRLYTRIISGIVSGATTNLYSCTFNVKSSSFIYDGAVYIKGRLWNCILNRCYIGASGSDYDAYNVVLTDAISGIVYGASGTFEDIKLYSNGRQIYFYGSYTITVKNVVIRNSAPSGTFRAVSTSVDSYLINADVDAWTFYTLTGTGKIYRQYEFNRTILDKNGNAYTGKAWALYNLDGSVAHSGTTQADGKLSATDLTVTHGYYNQANGDTEQTSGPFKLWVQGTEGHNDLNLLNLPIDTKDVTGVETMAETQYVSRGGAPARRPIQKVEVPPIIATVDGHLLLNVNRKKHDYLMIK